MWAFLCYCSSLLFHCIDWCFVDRSYSKTHDSSPMMVHPRSIGSASHSFQKRFLQWRFFFLLFQCQNFQNQLWTQQFYAFSYAKYQYFQWHLRSFFNSPSQFLASLFQHCVHCMQWPVDQLEHHRPPILFHFRNNPPTSSLLYSSTCVCAIHPH